MLKLIVCDIDNTLVPKHKLPSENTLRCIHELRANGILFGLASGRSTQQLQGLADQWGIKADLLVGLNGGEYQDCLTGDYYVLPKLKKEYIKEIFEIMEPFKDKVNVSMFVNGVHKTRRIDQQIIDSYKYRKGAELPTVVKDESEFWSEDTYKLGFRTPADIMPEIEKTVYEHNSSHFQAIKTEFTMFEFCHPNADKGEMVIRFCKAHNIPLEEEMSIGDMSNDLTLISKAGIGVCMLNGSDDAKNVAKIITEKSIEDDGWAYFIQKNVLDKINDKN